MGMTGTYWVVDGDPVDDESVDEDSEYSESNVDSDESLEDESPQAAAGSGLLQAFLAQIPQEQLAPVVVDQRTPQQHWRDFLGQVESSRTKILKVSDACMTKFGLDNTRSDLVANELVEAVESARGITHAILGDRALGLVKESGQQLHLLETIFRLHHETLTYLKLGSDESPSAIETSSFLGALYASQGKLQISEMEIRGLQLTSELEIARLAEILRESRETLRQVNLLDVTVTSGLVLDPLFAALCDSSTLDELRLVVVGQEEYHTTALVSPEGRIPYDRACISRSS
jgi:hypothetical protein